MKNFINKILSTKKYLIATIAILLAVVTATVVLIIALVVNKGPGDDSSGSSSPGGETPTTYVVSFETNGGSVLNSVTVEDGATLDLGGYVPSKEGCYFYGWCMDETFQTRAELVLEITADTKLYAEWGTEEKYLLTFETNGGTAIEGVLYRPNAYLAKPTDPVKANYAFGGWYKDAACTQEFSFFAAPQMPNKALTIYAKWNPLNGIVFQTNGGTAVEAVYGAVGDPIETLIEPTRENYIFEGWFADKNLTIPYEVSIIPKGTVTVYAKWHEQIKGIQVRLHINYADESKVLTVSGDEGEVLDVVDATNEFTSDVTALVKASYLGSANDLLTKPIYHLTAWAYDTAGSQRFDGKLPHKESVDLYAVWGRSATYCLISFVENEQETSYFVAKNSVVDNSVLDTHTATAKAKYEALGCKVDGFYTAGGNRYVAGDKIAMDMRLLPYIYSADLAYEYITKTTSAGVEVKGYALKGYETAKQTEYKQKDELLLLIPSYYNDGTHGQQSVIWINDGAFKGFNIGEVTMPDSIVGIGAEAFSATKLQSIALSPRLYYLGDNVFKGSASLESVTFNSDVSYIGATVFNGTAYEAQMPKVSTANGKGEFIFFDTAQTIIYTYRSTGANETVTTPSTARTIAGGAFKNNSTIKTLTISDGIRYVSDYAFENSAIESVKIGKFFSNMGVGIFKNCTKLVSVEFTYAYNVASLGESMFEGCTALKTIDLSTLVSLKEMQANAFKGCTSVESFTFNDNFLAVGKSAFEGCTSLYSVDFGTSDKSQFTQIDERAFAGCSSLRRIILRGNLINNQIVRFGKNVFVNAGYDKNGVFVTPVIYVKDYEVDNWRDEDDNNKIYSYVEIYKMRLPTEYKNITVKAIDARMPELIINGVVELSSSNDLASFDVLAYLTQEGVYEVRDDISAAEDCLVYISAVIYGTNQTLTGMNGKYNLKTVGTYTVILAAEDEFGNKAEGQVTITVKNA